MPPFSHCNLLRANPLRARARARKALSRENAVMWRHAVMDRGDRRPARRPAAGGQPPAPASRPGPVTGAAGASCSTRTVAGLRSASRAHAHACWVSPDSSGLGIRCGSLADVYGAQGRARRPWPVELVSPVAGRAGVARPDRCRLARIAARRALIWQPSRRRHGVGQRAGRHRRLRLSYARQSA